MWRIICHFTRTYYIWHHWLSEIDISLSAWEKQGEWTTRAVILLSLFFFYFVFTYIVQHWWTSPLISQKTHLYLWYVFYLQVGKGKFYRLKLNINLICKQDLQNSWIFLTAFSVEFNFVWSWFHQLQYHITSPPSMPLSALAH